jgi:hypothetical protein
LTKNQYPAIIKLIKQEEMGAMIEKYFVIESHRGIAWTKSALLAEEFFEDCVFNTQEEGIVELRYSHVNIHEEDSLLSKELDTIKIIHHYEFDKGYTLTSIEDWKNIFRNLAEEGEEVEVVWLDEVGGKDHWCLCFDCELFEDGFRTEEEAENRLEFLERIIQGQEG